jgi:2-keto-3-deoxy-L-rhamnonate aldolase RhmA
MAENAFLSRLRAGQLTLMMGLRSARTSDAVRIAAATGHHAVMIDLEHSAMSADVATQLAATAGDLGLTPLVRIPEREYGIIGRLLDGGACGIIAPRVEDAAQAEAVARACRFAPRGQRSQLAMVPQLGLRPAPAAELNPALDDQVVVVILVETPAVLARADEIAALDGVDLLAIGANDLTAELGAPGDFGDRRLAQAVSAAAGACERHGKLLMLGGVGDLDRLGKLSRLGACPLYLTGSDTDLLYAGARARSVQFTGWHSEGLSAAP